MPPTAPATKDQILAKIDKLILTLGGELQQVKARATPQQRDTARDLVGMLTLRLTEARADVAASADPATTWEDWLTDSIVPSLQQFSALVKAVVSPPPPLGLCVYDGGQFCSTQAECDLPNSSWTEGTCP